MKKQRLNPRDIPELYLVELSQLDGTLVPGNIEQLIERLKAKYPDRHVPLIPDEYPFMQDHIYLATHEEAAELLRLGTHGVDICSDPDDESEHVM